MKNFWLASAAKLEFTPKIHLMYGTVIEIRKGDRAVCAREDALMDLRDCCGLDAAAEYAMILCGELQGMRYCEAKDGEFTGHFLPLYLRLKPDEKQRVINVMKDWRQKIKEANGIH